MVRNSLKYVSWKDYKAVTTDLKLIYRSSTEEEALLELERFSDTWDEQYPQISKSWRANWENLNTLFNYPADIRKAIYTTNAIESLNSVIRKALKKRKVFPSDDSAKKMVYLAITGGKRWFVLLSSSGTVSRSILNRGSYTESVTGSTKKKTLHSNFQVVNLSV
jgi:transposase-like protein